MNLHLSDTERKVLAVIQKGFPDSRNPYKDMAEIAGIEVEQFLSVLRRWKQDGKLRRIGAVVNHFEVGIGVGAMVVWQVESERVEKVGQILAGFKEVSHAYERQITETWSYNLYSMVHGRNNEEIEQAIRKMNEACKALAYRVLFTEKELKKVPPTYIMP